MHSLRYALVFSALALGALAAFFALPFPARLMALNAALAFGGVALGYAKIGPRIFGKRGAQLPLWSWLLFWPYFALNYLSLWLVARLGKEKAFDEIVPRLWIGRRLLPGDAASFRALKIHAVLDLTAEFSEAGFVREVPHYLCVPLLDTTPPSPVQLRAALDFLQQHAPHGPVFIHCALGHGRSGTFAAAFLLCSGQVKSLADALTLLQKQRPALDVHDAQREFLLNFPFHAN
jgi:protein-tyrosine phosphatase